MNDINELERQKMKKGRKSGALGEEDLVLWQTVTKSVKPYGQRKPPQKAPIKTVIKERLKKPSAKITPPVVNVAATAQPPSKGFDKATSTKFKRGQLAIEGTLDLHGMTQDKAMTALQDFIRRAWRDRKRTLLIITGKGDRSKNTGVLRRMLPIWLEDGEFGNIVLALSQAQAKDGGDGAFYLRLRKGE